MTLTLPAETKECQSCGKRMVAAWTGVVFTTSPPGHEWIWWCKCGRREDGGVVHVIVSREDIEQRWERANKPSKKGD